MGNKFQPSPKSLGPLAWWGRSDVAPVFNYSTGVQTVSLLPNLADVPLFVNNGTAAQQPVYNSDFLNGIPGLTVAGAQRLFSGTATTIAQAVGGFSITAVVRRSVLDAAATAQHIWMTAANSGSNERFYIGWGAADQLVAGGRKSDTDTLEGCGSLTPLLRGTAYVVTAIFDLVNSTQKLRINGVPDTFRDPSTLIAGLAYPITAGSVMGVGFQTGNVAVATDNTTGNGCSFLGKTGGANFFIGAGWEAIALPRVPTDAEIQTIERYAANYYNLPSVDSYTTWITFDGSSSMQGLNLLGNAKMPSQLLALAGNPKNIGYINNAVSGSALPNQITAAVAVNGIDNRPIPPNVLPGKRILVCQLGSNDISAGTSPMATYALLRQYIQARKASGKYDVIFLILPQVRETTVISTNIQAYWALIKANLTQLKADGLTHIIDISEVQFLSADGDYNNLTYYQNDKIHPTQESQGLIAAKTYAKLKPYL